MLIKAAPQLWNIEDENHIARLKLTRIYAPLDQDDSFGPSYFGGKNDEFVLSATKRACMPENTFHISTDSGAFLGGTMYVWHCESGARIHHVLSSETGYPTCLAWRDTAEGEPLMIATAGHDGQVRIWTEPPAGIPLTPGTFTSSPANTTPSGHRVGSTYYFGRTRLLTVYYRLSA